MMASFRKWGCSEKLGDVQFRGRSILGKSKMAQNPRFHTTDSHCDRIHSAVRCFDNDYVGKKPLVWKEYCAEYWLKELQESMDMCTDRRDKTDILLKTALNTVQLINQPSSC